MMEYDLAVKRNEVLMHILARVKTENIMEVKVASYNSPPPVRFYSYGLSTIHTSIETEHE